MIFSIENFVKFVQQMQVKSITNVPNGDICINQYLSSHFERSFSMYFIISFAFEPEIDPLSCFESLFFLCSSIVK